MTTPPSPPPGLRCWRVCCGFVKVLKDIWNLFCGHRRGVSSRTGQLPTTCPFWCPSPVMLTHRSSRPAQAVSSGSPRRTWCSGTSSLSLLVWLLVWCPSSDHTHLSVVFKHKPVTKIIHLKFPYQPVYNPVDPVQNSAFSQEAVFAWNDLWPVVFIGQLMFLCCLCWAAIVCPDAVYPPFIVHILGKIYEGIFEGCEWSW